MAISVGDRLPDVELMYFDGSDPGSVALPDIIKGKTIALFGVPGAFTRTCSKAHLPSFMKNRQALADKGVEEVICVAVNDPFVMKAWSESAGAEEAGLRMLADPEGNLCGAMGLKFYAQPVGFLGRSKRFALVADDGVVRLLNVEESPGSCDISAAETLLSQM